MNPERLTSLRRLCIVACLAGVHTIDPQAGSPDRDRGSSSTWTASGVGSDLVRLSVTSDGRLAAASRSWRGGDIHVWDLSTGGLQGSLFEESSSFQDIVLGPAGETCTTVGMDGRCVRWELSSGTQLFARSVSDVPLRALAATSDGSRIVVGDDRGEVSVLDGSGKLLRSWIAHEGSVSALAIRTDGSELASGGEDGLTKTWSVDSGDLVRTLRGHSEWVRALAYDSKGEWLASGSDDGTAARWSTSTGTRTFTIDVRGGEVNAIAIGRNDSRIVTGSSEGTIRVWNAQDGSLVADSGLKRRSIRTLAITPDGDRVISGDSVGDISYWQLETARFIERHVGHQGAISRLVFSSDDAVLVSACMDGTVAIRESSTGELLRSIANPPITDPPPFLQPMSPFVAWNPAADVALMPAGRKLVIGCWDANVRIYDLEDGKLVRTLAGHSDSVFAIALSSDGRTVVSGGRDHSIRRWNVESGELIATHSGHTKEVRCLEVTLEVRAGDPGRVVTAPESGVVIYSASADGTVRRWEDDRAVWSFALQGTEPVQFALSPDRTRLAVACADGRIRILDAEAGSLVRELVGHGDAVVGVAYAIDGSKLTSCGQDRTVRTWDPNTGVVVAVDSSPRATGVVALAYDHDPESPRLAYGHGNGTIRVVPAP